MPGVTPPAFFRTQEPGISASACASSCDELLYQRCHFQYSSNLVGHEGRRPGGKSCRMLGVTPPCKESGISASVCALSCNELLYQFYHILQSSKLVRHDGRHRGDLEERTANQHAIVPGLFRTSGICGSVNSPAIIVFTPACRILIQSMLIRVPHWAGQGIEANHGLPVFHSCLHLLTYQHFDRPGIGPVSQPQDLPRNGLQADACMPIQIMSEMLVPLGPSRLMLCHWGP